MEYYFSVLLISKFIIIKLELCHSATTWQNNSEILFQAQRTNKAQNML